MRYVAPGLYPAIAGSTPARRTKFYNNAGIAQMDVQLRCKQ